MPFSFNSTKYGQVIGPLVADERLNPLGPGRPNDSARAAIESLTVATAFPKVANAEMAQCCLAGLWLYHNFLDESHRISQDIDLAEGSYWHAIMHRREPDASNSKYWWRRVGSHPVLDALREHAPSVGYDFTGPFDFVDLCERVRDTGGAEEEVARRVQLLEWRLLFDYCYDRSVG